MFSYPQITQLQRDGVWNRILALEWCLGLFEQRLETVISLDHPELELIRELRSWPPLPVPADVLSKIEAGPVWVWPPLSVKADNRFTGMRTRYQGAIRRCGGVLGSAEIYTLLAWVTLEQCLWGHADEGEAAMYLYYAALMANGFLNPDDHLASREREPQQFVRQGRVWVHREHFQKQVELLNSLAGETETWMVAAEKVRVDHRKPGLWGWKRLDSRFPEPRLGLGELNWLDARLVWEARRELLGRS
jgi:hypothetical protein